MSKIELDQREKTAGYELIAVLGIIFYSIQVDGNLNIPTFLMWIGPWMIFLSIILAFKKLQSIVTRKDFLCIFVHFVFTGLFASITIPVSSLLAASIVSILFFSAVCLDQNANYRYSMFKYPEEKYCSLIVFLFFLWLISFAFPNIVFFAKLYRLLYIPFILQILFCLHKAIEEWNEEQIESRRAIEEQIAFPLLMSLRRKFKSIVNFRSSTQLNGNDIFLDTIVKKNYFSGLTAVAGISLGVFIDILLVDIGNKH